MWAVAGSVGDIFSVAGLLLYGLRSSAESRQYLGVGASSLRGVGFEWFDPLEIGREGSGGVGHG